MLVEVGALRDRNDVDVELAGSRAHTAASSSRVCAIASASQTKRDAAGNVGWMVGMDHTRDTHLAFVAVLFGPRAGSVASFADSGRPGRDDGGVGPGGAARHRSSDREVGHHAAREPATSDTQRARRTKPKADDWMGRETS